MWRGPDVDRRLVSVKIQSLLCTHTSTTLPQAVLRRWENQLRMHCQRPPRTSPMVLERVQSDCPTPVGGEHNRVLSKYALLYVNVW